MAGTQLVIFDPTNHQLTPPKTRTPLARSTDPETSHRAAREGEESGAFAAEAHWVLQLVRANPDRTASELEDLVDCRDGKVRKRLAECRDDRGTLENGPKRPCEITGRTVLTWRAV